jgi:phage terminase large subunit-like protein
VLDDVPGALWPLDMIERARISPAAIPAMKRVVISIDPAVSVGDNSDETGIIVAGLGEDELGYVLADGSGKYLPHEWAKKGCIVISLLVRRSDYCGGKSGRGFGREHDKSC